MNRILGQLVGFVIGCMIAIVGAPIICLAEEATPTEIAVSEDVTTPAGHWVPLGDYKLTFFCNCRKCCGKWSGGPTASGTMPAEGRTVACGSLPLGTHILIEGMGERVVEDRGVKGRHIDVYMDSHSECLKLGVKHLQVFRWEKD